MMGECGGSTVSPRRFFLREEAVRKYEPEAKRKGVPEGSQTRGRPAQRPGGRTLNAYACPDEPSTARILCRTIPRTASRPAVR